jgi:molecular chaperone GrpE
MSAKHPFPSRVPGSKSAPKKTFGSSAGATTSARCCQVLAQLNEWRAKAEDYLEGWRRAQADLRNMKARLAEEERRMRRRAEASVFLDLLPILDQFQLAYQQAIITEGVENEWQRGLSLIMKQFEEVLARHGVEIVPAVGQQFNPEWHEAVEELTDTGEEDGIIVEEVQRGYKLHGKLLRPARVKVARKRKQIPPRKISRKRKVCLRKEVRKRT